MNGPDTDRAAWRRAMYGLLIVTSLAGVAARIAALDTPNVRDPAKRRPFLSANDRSRWCTVRALVEHGTYAIDDVVREPGWDTIDMVSHDGHLYSSKPPLLATLVAGEYWVLHRLTGSTLGEQPHALGRLMLATINLPALALYFVVLTSLVERYGTTDWGRVFTMAAATWGTLLTTFGVTLNNHLLAAVAAVGAVALVLRIVRGQRARAGTYLLCGLATGLMAALELPALALALPLALWLFAYDARRTVAWFAPGVLLVTIAALATNYAAHGTIQPAYARQMLDPASGENWYVYSYEHQGRTIESYWQHPQGVDRGEPSRAVYAFHILFGHHGVFSLTPVWLASAVGLGLWLRGRGQAPWLLGALIAGVSLVCLAFYLSRPMLQRNYGGTAAGFRWLFWFAPLWLVAMLPAVDTAAGHRAARGWCLALLAVSVFSACYPVWNPWTHPWLYNLWVWLAAP
ncbi:MAG: hypothetical protein K1X74_15980 [Pirellulales bacterium]|nr:hypothetical protein [Pirellulales bacterium]